MRNYWLKIFLGAFAIFAIGMIGVTLFRSGVEQVHRVVESDSPIDIPVAFVPFVMKGERLGTLKHIVLRRSAPREVEEVELRVDVGDSLVAQGLSECRLAAHFEGDQGRRGVNIHPKGDSTGAFFCLQGDSIPEDLVEFGEAVFLPGDVRVPLFLQRDLVADLEEGFAGDSAAPGPEVNADSIAAQAQREVDSALSAAGLRGTAVGRVGQRLGDSLRKAALARVDSLQRERGEMADTLPER
jgi:hypothetical protein